MVLSPTPSLPSTSTPPSVPSPATSVTEPEAEVAEETLHTINDLLQSRAKGHHGNEPLVAYPTSGTDYIYYTPRQLDTFVEAASVHYAKAIPQRRLAEDPVQVVGLLGPSDFEYLITLLAVSRLGHTVLLLSTRIAEDAYISLVESTKATFLITHSSFQTMGDTVAGRTGITQQPLLTREDYDVPPADSVSLSSAHLDGAIEAKHICWIIHSSGSTGHPKPIHQTHSGALKNYANNFGLRGFITLPLFHAHGISCLFRAMHSQKLIYMYSANLPLTAPNLLSTLEEHPEIDILYAVPYALKLLSESDEGLQMMARLELVMFGGSACPKPIGDKLVQNGVRLVSHYGTTETGQLMTSFRERDDLDWDYVRPSPSVLPYLSWEEQMPGIYELCVLKGWPSKVASNRPDNSYATKDLFEKHPTKANAWRYYARLDDTLVLENGEKANPLVIEGVARNDPNVAEAIAFGANKPRLGLFLVPATSSQCETDEQLIETIFPAIELCNAELPAYAYISRDMIHVLPPDAVYRKTDKGTVIRSAFYRDYQEQIDQIYDAEDASGDQVLEGAGLVSFLREQLLAVAPAIDPSTLEETTDVFSLGMDSLQSIRLRTAIIRTLDIGGNKLSQNFVFEHPSLQAMAEALTRLRLGQGPTEQIAVEERMASLIEKYSTDFKTHVPVPREGDGEHIVVTGATGSLGAHVVAQLAQLENVKTIYCLVRADSRESAFRRVHQSLRTRKLSYSLTPATQRKIVALPADLSNPTRLGMDESIYAHLMHSITAVMHCAWSVNFNWSLESFEGSCIAGTRHLLDLCLDIHAPHPARFSFCSSVSTVARTPGQWVPEALPDTLACAQRMGYAQSKLVTEHIVNRAAQHTGMTARVLRVGQIIADTARGIWNATEAIPMIFQTAETIHALPQLDDILSWTPVDMIATSVIDLTLAPVAGAVMNVSNPTLDHWTRDLLPLLRQAGLEFEELPQREWLQRLRDSNADPDTNPPIKLLEFFTSKYDHDLPSRALLYDTKQAVSAAPALREAGGLTPELVTKFIDFFRTQCWTTTSSSQSPQQVIFLTGPCGSGKTTLSQALARQFPLSVIKGDDLHSPASREKMSHGIPLQDKDRWAWLAHIRGAVMDRLQHSDSTTRGVAVTCSTLRTVYRDELRRLADLLDFPVTVTFLLLVVRDREELKGRMVGREGHYMPEGMVDSQVDLLEEPLMSEGDVITLDAGGDMAGVLEEVEGFVGEILRL
ncbi:acetyl-CoA synthetase-like protein [Aspergillus sclerotioniger CBS 115572]|uniref:gluconokinase n=1 Tax=Aspergillus sclerotioniger CBS 115572 TaxID=1450535 RepID=A0A317WR07_9EURO|nr:acetyl-CoA synthetase-like protein [Aspergillus sclerotioniger CBS 115572]PWY88879.1 acetyl-CoA synthetase-like protein [Aspergillus sclerotioniger CBS 115572]